MDFLVGPSEHVHLSQAAFRCRFFQAQCSECHPSSLCSLCTGRQGEVEHYWEESVTGPDHVAMAAPCICLTGLSKCSGTWPVLFARPSSFRNSLPYLNCRILENPLPDVECLNFLFVARRINRRLQYVQYTAEDVRVLWANMLPRQLRDIIMTIVQYMFITKVFFLWNDVAIVSR